MSDDDDGLKAMGQVIQIDEGRIWDHLGEMVRGTVEETLNALLDTKRASSRSSQNPCLAGHHALVRGFGDFKSHVAGSTLIASSLASAATVAVALVLTAGW